MTDPVQKLFLEKPELIELCAKYEYQGVEEWSGKADATGDVSFTITFKYSTIFKERKLTARNIYKYVPIIAKDYFITLCKLNSKNHVSSAPHLLILVYDENESGDVIDREQMYHFNGSVGKLWSRDYFQGFMDGLSKNGWIR